MTNIKIYSNHGCGRCEIVKKMLTNKGIEFESFMLDDLDTTEKQALITMARTKNMMTLPIILKDGNVVDIKEV